MVVSPPLLKPHCAMQGDPKTSAEPEEAAEGQLNAGRIMERSRSSNSSSQDFSEHLFGSSIGMAAKPVCT